MELHLDNLPKTLELVEDEAGLALRYIDERKLPGELAIVQAREWREVVDAVKVLAIRGAPAIGIAGAAALALWAAASDATPETAPDATPETVRDAATDTAKDAASETAADTAKDVVPAKSAGDMEEVAETIASARPTAVNLRWAVNRALDVARTAIAHDTSAPAPASAFAAAGRLRDALVALVREMQEEDERVNRAIGANGAELLAPGSRILTHCNAGSLATYFYGTALGIVYAAAAQGKIERVYADETRPVGQGARLTVWELARAGVPVTLICDNMAASLMAKGEVDAVIVGADRIARNGDTANKIGTYGLAVLAREHGIPFYVAAPFSTLDAEVADGTGIEIEQRSPSEVLSESLEGVDVWNPAFDVTPSRYITKIITEKGAFEPTMIARQDVCSGYASSF